MAEISIKIIDESYNQEILDIIRRSPISTNELTLNFDRSPDFFALHKAGFEHARYTGLFIDNELKGFVGACYYDGYVDGKEESIIYYTNLYVLPEGRKRGFVYKSFDLLMKDRYKNARLGLTVIMKGNDKANRMVGRKLESYPYVFHNKVCYSLTVKNILITFRKRESNVYTIETAKKQDVDAIVALLQEEYKGRTFAPRIDKEVFLRNVERRPNFGLQNYYVAKMDGAVVGVCGALDTTGLKQTRVLKYKGKLRWIKLLYQLFTPLLGFPPLPKKGECFKDITLIDHATQHNNPEIMEALLKHVYNSYRPKGYNNIIFGSYEDDDLIKSADSFHSTTVESNIVLGCESEELLQSINVYKPYVNSAFL